jgi:hypothetical protein
MWQKKYFELIIVTVIHKIMTQSSHLSCCWRQCLKGSSPQSLVLYYHKLIFYNIVSLFSYHVSSFSLSRPQQSCSVPPQTFLGVMSTGTWKREWCNRSRRKSFKCRIESQITPVSIKHTLSLDGQPLSLTAKSLVWFRVNIHFFLFMMSVSPASLRHESEGIIDFWLIWSPCFFTACYSDGRKSPHSQEPDLFWIYVHWINICVCVCVRWQQCRCVQCDSGKFKWTIYFSFLFY